MKPLEEGKLMDLKYFKIGLLDRFLTDKGKCIDFACGKELLEYVVFGQLPVLGCPSFCLCKECGDALLKDPEVYLKNFHRYLKGLKDWRDKNLSEEYELAHHYHGVTSRVLSTIQYWNPTRKEYGFAYVVEQVDGEPTDEPVIWVDWEVEKIEYVDKGGE